MWQKEISDSFFQQKLRTLPYKINNIVLRAPFYYDSKPFLRPNKDSLIPCKWYTDSIVDAHDYLEYVRGYIHCFELPKLENGRKRDSAFWHYAITNTTGKLREELCYYQLITSFEIGDKRYADQFNWFKTIATNNQYIADIENKICDNRKK